MSAVKRIHYALNSHEQLILLKQPNPRVPTGIRNLSIINLMLKAGLRVSEIINLNNEDIDWEKGSIHIGKSGAARERTLLLEEPELSCLEKWSSLKPNSSSYVFTTLNGSQLKDRYIREMVKRLARKAGIQKDVYPHLLRYTFGIEFLRTTRDINLLQLALGHSDPAATQAYAKHMFSGQNEIFNSEVKNRCSGMPAVNIQQSISVSDSIIKHDGRNKEQYSDYETIARNKQEPGKYYLHTGAVVKEKATTDTKRYAVKMTSNEDELETLLKPEISFDSSGQEIESLSIKIPAIKCSNCSYILRHKANCPKCGIKFKDIIEHWRRNI